MKALLSVLALSLSISVFAATSTNLICKPTNSTRIFYGEDKTVKITDLFGYNGDTEVTGVDGSFIERTVSAGNLSLFVSNECDANFYFTFDIESLNSFTKGKTKSVTVLLTYQTADEDNITHSTALTCKAAE